MKYSMGEMRMRIAVMLYQNMKHAPFLRVYEDLLREINAEYDIVYLDRHPELEEKKDEHHIPIKWNNNNGFFRYFVKILNAGGYMVRAAKILSKNEYDFVVLLTTMPAVLLYPFIRKRYAQRYLVDIRDYTRENWKWYYAIEKRIIRESSINIISSPGFLNFLPRGEYRVCHNLNVTEDEIERCTFKLEKKLSGRIVVSYVGHIQYPKYCMKFAELIAKDERFELRFFGGEGGTRMVTQFVEGLKCDRIKMYGPFMPEDKERIFTGSDLIFNCYGNDRPLSKYLLSNKQYDAAYYRCPLLVSPDTTMADAAGENAFAIDLLSAESLDELYNWYCALDKAEFEKYAEGVLRSAMRENEETKKMIQSTILSATR